MGRGITSDVKYFIALFGAYSIIESISLIITMCVLIGYLVFCYFLGWYWMNHGWYESEIEVGNQFNLFVKEMRETFK